MVVGNPVFTWCPETNQVQALVPGEFPADIGAPEPDTRYQKLLDIFKAVRQVDAYSPTAPTYIARRFELERQIPEKAVEELLVAVLESAEVKQLAQVIRQRLGRPLEPFDVWYAGFSQRRDLREEELDPQVRQRYPDVSSFQADLPRILGQLGFGEEKARYLAERIVVDPSRGAGHAMGARRYRRWSCWTNPRRNRSRYPRRPWSTPPASSSASSSTSASRPRCWRPIRAR